MTVARPHRITKSHGATNDSNMAGIVYYLVCISEFSICLKNRKLLLHAYAQFPKHLNLHLIDGP